MRKHHIWVTTGLFLAVPRGRDRLRSVGNLDRHPFILIIFFKNSFTIFLMEIGKNWFLLTCILFLYIWNNLLNTIFQTKQLLESILNCSKFKHSKWLNSEMGVLPFGETLWFVPSDKNIQHRFYFKSKAVFLVERRISFLPLLVWKKSLVESWTNWQPISNSLL